jgi:probable HAF family extracellular repeat protein
MTMKTSSRFNGLLIAASLLFPLAPAIASPVYTVKVVGPAGSAAKGINASGQVVGSLSFGSTRHAFVYNGTHTYDIGTLGGPMSIAYGINDYGVVVGQADNAAGRPRAFAYYHGHMTNLGTLPGGDLSVATAINRYGVITGYSGTGEPPDHGTYGFRYRSGHMVRLAALPAGLGSYGYSINNGGTIAGAAYEGPYTPPEYPNYPVIYKYNVPAKISGYQGEANGINDYGQVVGGINTYDLPFPHARRPFFWQPGSSSVGTITFLGSLDATLDDGYATAINNCGVVVGNSAVQLSSERYGYQGFVWTRRHGIRNLNALIDPASGWTVTEANAINCKGQIAGTACKDGACHTVRLDHV